MFGILADNTFSTEFFKVAEESFKIKKVEITDEDHSTIVDITTVTDTVCAAYWALYNAVPGHEFNVVSHRVSKAMLKRIIFEGFSNCLSSRNDFSYDSKDKTIIFLFDLFLHTICRDNV